MPGPFELEAMAKGPDGSLSPIKLTISEPAAEETGEFGCLMDCSLIRFDRHKVFGADAGQAMALAMWLAEDQLDHHGYIIVDDKGERIRLPIDPDAVVPGQESAKPDSG